MASKLDKLRKLHADKMLTEDDMDNIAGGQMEYDSWGADSRFLNTLLGGSVCDRWGDYKAENHHEEIRAAWARVGVSVKVTKLGKDNFNRNYYVDGKYVTAKEAYAHAMKVTGKYLTPEQWNW